jgi:CheY-like chemotaxis protein
MYDASLETFAGSVALIADDNPDNLAVLSGMLEHLGYRVRVARDGAQALASARASAPDIVLLDVHMPVMDGYEACAGLKADPGLRDIPVMFVSALSDPFNKRKAIDAGALDYITKPFSLEDVANRVRNLLALGYYKRRCAELEARLAAAGPGHE